MLRNLITCDSGKKHPQTQIQTAVFGFIVYLISSKFYKNADSFTRCIPYSSPRCYQDTYNKPYFREFAAMFTEADKNNDGRIDFEEFSAMMIPPPPGGAS